MSKTILVKAESFYTFLEENVLGYQNKQDNTKAIYAIPSISSCNIFEEDKKSFVYSMKGIEVSDRIIFEFSEFNYFLRKTIEYTAIFEVQEHDSVLHKLYLFDKSVKH